nr:MAG TPA: RecT protein [Caudoviricetes sp.]
MNQIQEYQDRKTELEVKKFELEQRKAKAFVATDFFPTHLRKGNETANIGTAIIVLDLAQRMNIGALEVAQSIYIIHGKPSFETKFLVARLNSSGLLKGRLQTIVSPDGNSAHCEAIDAQTGQLLKGTTITMEMARREGWLSKNGSKWQTMPELMMKYRAQSFFINEFFPEVKYGLKTSDEAEDIVAFELNEQSKTSPKASLNELLSSSEKPNSSVGAKNSQTEYIEAAPLEVEIATVKENLTVEPMPLDLLQSELVKRGASETEAEKLVERLSVDDATAYLNDPSSIDNLIENLRN